MQVPMELGCPPLLVTPLHPSPSLRGDRTAWVLSQLVTGAWGWVSLDLTTGNIVSAPGSPRLNVKLAKDMRE